MTTASPAADTFDASATSISNGSSRADLELGMDIVSKSLAVLSNLLCCAKDTAVTTEELGYLIWLIEEKATAV